MLYIHVLLSEMYVWMHLENVYGVVVRISVIRCWMRREGEKRVECFADSGRRAHLDKTSSAANPSLFNQVPLSFCLSNPHTVCVCVCVCVQSRAFIKYSPPLSLSLSYSLSLSQTHTHSLSFEHTRTHH